MNEQIKSVLNILKLEFILFWILCLGLVVGYETGLMEAGVYCGQATTEYVLQNIGIVLMIGLIPMSLRLFKMSIVQKMKELPLLDALRSYRRWSEIRLAMLFVPACINLSFYYLTFNSSSVFCAAMTLVATLFCVPSCRRLVSELELPLED